MGKNKKVMMGMGVLIVVALFALVWKFGESWDSWVTASAVVGIVVVPLILFRPSIAKEWFGDIGDGLKNLLSNLFAKKKETQNGEEKKEEPKPPVA